MAAGFFLFIFVENMYQLLAVQALIGFGEAFYSPAYDGLYSKHLSKRVQSRQWGLWEAMYYSVSAGGAALGGFIALTYGFTTLFIMMGALAALSAFYLLLLPRNIL